MQRVTAGTALPAAATSVADVSFRLTLYTFRLNVFLESNETEKRFERPTQLRV
jgi:hypothetical protein